MKRTTSKFDTTKGNESRERRGVTAVEFALVAPIIFAFFFASIEIVNLNYLRNMASDAAFQVARDSVIPGANRSQAIQTAQNMMTSVGLVNPSISIQDQADGSIIATVSLPIDQNAWGVSKLAVGTIITRNCHLDREVK